LKSVFKPTQIVLALLCVMYFITYVDRVNISTAASAIQDELGLNKTEFGLAFSVFGYPYLAFQIAGGWLGDRFGARRVLVWSGLIWGAATIATGFATGLVTLIIARVLLGFGEGATFPTATRAMQHWTSSRQRGFAQGLTHAFARLGNTVTPGLIAVLIAVVAWRGSLVVLGLVSLVWVAVWGWYFRNNPSDHPKITTAELQALPVRALDATRPSVPWIPLLRRMWPVTLTYFCYGWALWLYLTWIPQFFQNSYNLNLNKSVFFITVVYGAGAVGDTIGGLLSDFLLRRTGNVRLARLGVTIMGFLGACASLMPMLFSHDLMLVTLCLSGGFFFAELTIGPMWSVPMDIAPKYSGTAAGLMNSGSALAIITSPVINGYIIDVTGNYYLPFLMLLVVLLLGAAFALLMHPETPFDTREASIPVGGEVAAE
jgi:MFS family permease